MNISVLHIIGHLSTGGAQSSLYYLWAPLSRASDYQFEYLTIHEAGHFGEKLISEGARVDCLNIKGKYNPAIIQGIANKISTGSYHIVHAHLFPEIYFVPLAARLSRRTDIHLIYTEHSISNRRRRYPWLFSPLESQFYRQYERVIAVSATTYQSLLAWQPSLSGKVHLITNSIRLEEFNKGGNLSRSRVLEGVGIDATQKPTVLLFAGRLSHAKGCDLLIKALAQIPDCDYDCLIAGEGPDLEKLESLVKAFHLEKRVRFLGARSDVRALLSCADILVVPSRWEGMPLIILEGMAAKCPIVASSAGGIGDVLQDGETALLVPPGDVNLLAAGIAQMIEEPALRAGLAKNAWRTVQAYSADQGAAMLLDLYGQVMEHQRHESTAN